MTQCFPDRLVFSKCQKQVELFSAGLKYELLLDVDVAGCSSSEDIFPMPLYSRRALCVLAGVLEGVEMELVVPLIPLVGDVANCNHLFSEADSAGA